MPTKKDLTKTEYSFENEIQSFIDHVDSLINTLPVVMRLIATRLMESSKKLEKFLKVEGGKDTQQGRLYNVKIEDLNEFQHLRSNVESARIAYKLLPKTMVVSMISQYDAYLGRIIRTLYHIKPELAKKIERSFKYSDLLNFNTFNEMKDEIIEKEIDSIMRESHYQQLKMLENKISTDSNKFTLTKDLHVLPTFIEVCERRNLFVHCNGFISRQYLNVCKEHNVSGINKLKLNQELSVSPMYAELAYKAIFEVGVKLGHVLWRKLHAQNRKNADKHLNNLCFDLINSEQYVLALTMLTFATEEIKEHCSDDVKKYLIVNKALAYYLNDQKQQCKNEFAKTDWTASNDIFKLAEAVLYEKYNDAVKIMKNIGHDHETIGRAEYQEWPLFKNFRNTKEFQKTYKEIFGEDFKIVEKQPKEFVQLIASLEKKKNQKSNSVKRKNKRNSRIRLKE